MRRTETLQLRLTPKEKAALTEAAVAQEVTIAEFVRQALRNMLADPRTPEQREADRFAAEVLDTQESDRP